MRHRRGLGRKEKLRNAAVSIISFAASVTVLVVLATTQGVGNAEAAKGIALSALFAFYATVKAVTFLPHRASDARRHASVRKRPAGSTKWTPPVNEEFERFRNSYFISATPCFMRRGVLHADPGSVVTLILTYMR